MSAEPVNILLVDDQAAKLMTYEAILRDLGETLFTAASAREALALLLKEDIAVILVDVCMPELDGYALAAMIREHPRFRKTSIIFVSAVLMNDVDRLRGYECGAVDYVPVPVVPEILRAKVSVFAELYRKTRQLELLNERLEQRVLERTAALEATTAALRESDRRKDEFLAMLSHELRNPLAPIRTAVSLLDAPGLSAEQHDSMKRVLERQVDQLIRLTDDLLDVSRMSRDVLLLDCRDVSLAVAVARAVETNRPLIDAHRLELDVVGADPALRVHGDEARLVQALGNLINNAAKFTPEGGSIRLSMERDSDAAVVRVRDSGIGLPSDMRDRIFEPFVQLERSNRRSGGLGVGLALVRRLVEMHGGGIEARSEGPGTGTEMVVRLPLAIAPGVDAHPSDSRPRPDRDVPRRRILVVDDNQDAADTIALSLSNRGHDVQVAYDGAEALARAVTFEPETILLDLGMPGLDGYTVAGEIRRQPWGGRTYLIALTGWGQLVDRQRTAAAGFDRHLVKPVGDAELVQALGAAPRARV